MEYKESYCVWCGKTTKFTLVDYNSGLGTCTECGAVRNPKRTSNKKNDRWGAVTVKEYLIEDMDIAYLFAFGHVIIGENGDEIKIKTRRSQ